jgi:hypothetical protein
MRIIGWLLTVVALTLLQACSAIKLAYNNAPEFGYWWLDAYGDFNETQSPKVRAELARLLLWHRTEELPKIADLLQKTQRLATNDTSPAPVCGLFADARLRFNAVTAQAEAATVSVAMSLSPEQLAHIERKFTKNNTEWRNDWLKLSPTERIDKRLKSNLERSEEFYGKLEDRQLVTLRSSLAASIYDTEVMHAERVRRQQDLLQTLRQISGRTNVTEATSALRAYVDRSLNSPNPVYRAYIEKIIAESCTQFAQLHNSTTFEQRTRAVRRLAAYERDARELNGQR